MKGIIVALTAILLALISIIIMTSDRGRRWLTTTGQAAWQAAWPFLCLAALITWLYGEKIKTAWATSPQMTITIAVLTAATAYFSGSVRTGGRARIFAILAICVISSWQFLFQPLWLEWREKKARPPIAAAAAVNTLQPPTETSSAAVLTKIAEIKSGETLYGSKEPEAPAIPLIFRCADGKERILPPKHWQGDRVVYTHSTKTRQPLAPAVVFFEGDKKKYTFFLSPLLPTAATDTAAPAPPPARPNSFRYSYSDEEIAVPTDDRP